jgi:hypothetical protein
MVKGSLSAELLSCSNDRAIISSSILRDIKLVLASFVVTCIIIFVYNYRLQQRCNAIAEKAKVRWIVLLVLLIFYCGALYPLLDFQLNKTILGAPRIIRCLLAH